MLWITTSLFVRVCNTPIGECDLFCVFDVEIPIVNILVWNLVHQM